METKTANLYIRIEPSLKEKAENILSSLGISSSSAINMFYKQIVLQNGLPFEVKLPTNKPLDISNLSKEELNKEINKGLNDCINGDTLPADEAFMELKKNFNL